MIQLNIRGVHDLAAGIIDRMVPEEVIGNYVLGYREGSGGIRIKYVGRSDTDLNRRLHEHLDESYDAFMFNTQDTPEEAYLEECRNWHKYGGDKGRLYNKNHPDRPEGCTEHCPVCSK